MNSQFQTAVLSLSPTQALFLGDLNGTIAYDSSGNGNDGTFVGSVTLNQAGPSAGNPSVLLTGTNPQYINSNYTPTSTTKFTCLSYIRLTDLLNYYEAYGFSASGTSGFVGKFDQTTGSFDVSVSYGSGQAYLPTITGGSTSVFALVAITVNGATVTAYLNAASSSGTLGGTYVPPTGPLYFGARNNGSGGAPDKLNGNIGGCAFWDGVALSAGRISALYTALLAGTPATNPRLAGGLALGNGLGPLG